MAETPIALRVPEECPSCHRRGQTRLQTAVTGARVVLMWVCQACEHEWPVIQRETETARVANR